VEFLFPPSDKRTTGKGKNMAYFPPVKNQQKNIYAGIEWEKPRKLPGGP